MPGLKDRLTDAGYGLGWSVVCRVPESWAQSAFRFFADLAWRRQGPGVQVARRFEAGIRAHPQDWHMLQRVFLADLDRERLRRTARS
jgi:lauroyl/myristoyl acyltransferase